MIVCSCNVFSDQQVRSALAKASQRLRMSQVYNCLGYTAQCGQCAHTIKQIMKQVTNCSVASVAALTDRTRERSKRGFPSRQGPASAMSRFDGSVDA